MENIEIKHLFIIINKKTNEPINDLVFDEVWNFRNGFANVRIKGRGWNFINTKGELLYKGDKWFNHTWNFYEGFARVYKKGKGWNYINEQGEYLWKEDKWFDNVKSFYNGFASVKYKGYWYNLNTKGELI